MGRWKGRSPSAEPELKSGRLLSSVLLPQRSVFQHRPDDPNEVVGCGRHRDLLAGRIAPLNAFEVRLDGRQAVHRLPGSFGYPRRQRLQQLVAPTVTATGFEAGFEPPRQAFEEVHQLIDLAKLTTLMHLPIAIEHTYCGLLRVNVQTNVKHDCLPKLKFVKLQRQHSRYNSRLTEASFIVSH